MTTSVLEEVRRGGERSVARQIHADLVDIIAKYDPAANRERQEEFKLVRDSLVPKIAALNDQRRALHGEVNGHDRQVGSGVDVGFHRRKAERATAALRKLTEKSDTLIVKQNVACSELAKLEAEQLRHRENKWKIVELEEKYSDLKK